MLSRLCTLTPLRVTALGSVSDPITVLSDPITVLSELRPHYKDSEHKLGLPKVRIQNTSTELSRQYRYRYLQPRICSGTVRTRLQL